MRPTTARVSAQTATWPAHGRTTHRHSIQALSRPTAAAPAACPEGNEKPWLLTRANGGSGRCRPTKVLAVTMMTATPTPPTRPRTTGSHERARHAATAQTRVSHRAWVGASPRWVIRVRLAFNHPSRCVASHRAAGSSIRARPSPSRASSSRAVNPTANTITATSPAIRATAADQSRPSRSRAVDINSPKLADPHRRSRPITARSGQPRNCGRRATQVAAPASTARATLSPRPTTLKWLACILTVRPVAGHPTGDPSPG